MCILFHIHWFFLNMYVFALYVVYIISVSLPATLLHWIHSTENGVEYEPCSCSYDHV